MRNLWVQTEHPFATWVADLDRLRAAPASLLEFAVAVVGAGAAHGVFDVVWAPLLDYDRDRGDDLGDRLVAAYRAHGVVDLFGFTGAAMAPAVAGSSTCEAVLAWYDEADRLAQGRCSDLGALLVGVASRASVSRGFTRHYPPVRVTGHRLDYASARRRWEPTNFPRSRPLTVRFEIHSDIWFPWVVGSAHPEADHRRMFDNRALATIHTPRLNAFLRAVADRTRTLGGEWYVDDEETATNAITWVSKDGITVDAAPPAETFAPGAAESGW